MRTEIVEQITFTHSDLDHLSEEVRCIFVQAAIVITDLRFFDLELHQHFHYFKKRPKLHSLEAGVHLSQVVLLLSHLAGALCEANNVLRQSYFSPTVSKEYDSKLSSNAKEALSRVKMYFSKRDNLATVIRNNFGFHYDRTQIAKFLKDLPPDWEHHTYLTQDLNNSFVEFGQVCSMNALFKATGATNGVEGMLRLFKDLHSELLRDFVVFFHGLLQAISANLPAKSQQVRARLSANSPALFFHFHVP